MSGACEGKRAVVQDLGSVGCYAAQFRQEEDGARVVAIIEREGGIVNGAGLGVEPFSQHLRSTGGAKDFPGGTHVEDGASVLEKDYDILIPAAFEGQITSDNAARIKAPLIVEAANGPVAVGAAAILSEAGNVIMPDLFVNAGGVTVSHIEWIKDHQLIEFGRRGRSPLEARQESCAGVLEGKRGREICDKGDDSLDPHRLVAGMSRVKGTGAGRPREGGGSGVVGDGCCEFLLARIQSVFTERKRGIDQPLTSWADPSSMETRVFIDDGYPESREYNDNYCLVGDPEAERDFQGWTQVNAPVGERGVPLQRLLAAMRSATRLLLPGDVAGSPSKERGPAPPLGRLVARVEGAATLEGPAAAGEGSDPSRDLPERGVLGGGRRVG